MTRPNEAKLHAAMQDVARICDRYRADNAAEGTALMGIFIGAAATVAADSRQETISNPQMERFVRAAEDAFNDILGGRRKR